MLPCRKGKSNVITGHLIYIGGCFGYLCDGTPIMSLTNTFCGNVQLHVLHMCRKNCLVEEIFTVEQGVAMQELNKRLLKFQTRHFYF